MVSRSAAVDATPIPNATVQLWQAVPGETSSAALASRRPPSRSRGSPASSPWPPGPALRLVRAGVVGTVVWDSSACAVGDQERTVAFDLPSNEAEVGLGGGSKGKDFFVRLVSTAGAANQPWIGFVPFGQVAIHTVKLTGKISHRGQ